MAGSPGGLAITPSQKKVGKGRIKAYQKIPQKGLLGFHKFLYSTSHTASASPAHAAWRFQVHHASSGVRKQIQVTG